MLHPEGASLKRGPTTYYHRRRKDGSVCLLAVNGAKKNSQEPRTAEERAREVQERQQAEEMYEGMPEIETSDEEDEDGP